MNLDQGNLADLSLEAALQLEEVRQKVRRDAPALTALFSFIRTPAPAFEDKAGVSLLCDARAYSLLRDSTKITIPANSISIFADLIEKYLKSLEDGINQVDGSGIDEAKRFCLALNSSVVSKQMNELSERRDRQDSRNIVNEPLF